MRGWHDENTRPQLVVDLSSGKGTLVHGKRPSPASEPRNKDDGVIFTARLESHDYFGQMACISFCRTGDRWFL